MPGIKHGTPACKACAPAHVSNTFTKQYAKKNCTSLFVFDFRPHVTRLRLTPSSGPRGLLGARDRIQVSHVHVQSLQIRSNTIFVGFLFL